MNEFADAQETARPASAMVDFVDPVTNDALLAVENGYAAPSGVVYPIEDEIPRFVASGAYAAAFGYQWNLYTETQLDSRTGTSISRERLERCLGLPVSALAGLRVLEAGCGAGRFTEHLVAAGAMVHAVDLSAAVSANRQNIETCANYSIAQADLRSLPFPDDAFDAVLCLGVLQHTPSPEHSIELLWRKVKPGGTLVIDHYRWSWGRLKTDALLRPILKRLPPATAARVIDRIARALFPIHWRLRNHWFAATAWSRMSPLYCYFDSYPQLTKEQHYEWTRLDTFDGTTDRYKRLRTTWQIDRTLRALGAVSVWVTRGGNGIEARCVKPRRAPAGA